MHSLSSTPFSSKGERLALVEGSTSRPLRNCTLGTFVQNASSTNGRRTALSVPWQNYRASYCDLDENSARIAKALIASNIRAGEHVGIMAGNRHEFIEIFLGSARIGCPVVCLNNTYVPSELELALIHSDCSRLFIASTIGSRDMSKHIEVATNLASRNGTRMNEVIILGDVEPQLAREITYAQFRRRAAGTNDVQLKLFEQSPHHLDGVMLQFTSGTTGHPKSSVLTHQGILTNGQYVGDAMQLGADDVLVCPPPLFHTFGIVVGFLAAFTHSCPIVFPSDTFNAECVVDLIADHGVTVLLGVPTMFIAELDVMQRRKITPRNLRTGIIGGSPVPKTLMERIAREMKFPKLLVAYGTTETSPISFVTSLDDPMHLRYASVGRVLPNTMARVADADGHTLMRGERGELYIAGYSLHLGYYRNSAATQAAMRQDDNGTVWIRSGDEALIDEQGYCHITGRIKDIIIRGGENIYPAEIEERLMQHPAIIEASVVGIRSDRYGEVVGAFLQSTTPNGTRPSDGQLQSWVGESLGRHKIPARLFWLGDQSVCDEYPKTGSGKVKKYVLSELGTSLVSTIT